jgi:hypothetical protein
MMFVGSGLCDAAHLFKVSPGSSIERLKDHFLLMRARAEPLLFCVSTVPIKKCFRSVGKTQQAAVYSRLYLHCCSRHSRPAMPPHCNWGMHRRNALRPFMEYERKGSATNRGLSRWTHSIFTTACTEVMAKNKEEYENGISLRVNMTTWRFVGSRHEHTENLPSKDIVLFAEAASWYHRLEEIQQPGCWTPAHQLRPLNERVRNLKLVRLSFRGRSRARLSDTCHAFKKLNSALK